jgi:CAAX prenyl protease-like protein
MLFLQLESLWPQHLDILYPLKTVAVGALLWLFWGQYSDLKLSFCPVAVLVGALVIVIWIVIDPFYPTQSQLLHKLENLGRALSGLEPLAPRAAAPFDPSGNWWFIGFRITGAVVVVPLMEELFWRAFLLRWLIQEDFKRVPLGAFSWLSFVGTTVLFGLAHQQWLAAVICGALYNGLLYWRKDLFACVIAHAVSNGLLAAYVLATADWKFW